MIWHELGLQIQRIERNAELIRHAAGILGIGRRAAALLVMQSRRSESPDSRSPLPLLLPHAAGDCSPWRMKTPITSCPCSTSRWAATLESTPPLMASTTRDILRV